MKKEIVNYTVRENELSVSYVNGTKERIVFALLYAKYFLMTIIPVIALFGILGIIEGGIDTKALICSVIATGILTLNLFEKTVVKQFIDYLVKKLEKTGFNDYIKNQTGIDCSEYVIEKDMNKSSSVSAYFTYKAANDNLS